MRRMLEEYASTAKTDEGKHLREMTAIISGTILVCALIFLIITVYFRDLFMVLTFVVMVVFSLGVFFIGHMASFDVDKHMKKRE